MCSYKNKDPEEAAADFRQRIAQYEKAYQTLDESDKDHSKSIKMKLEILTASEHSVCEADRCGQTGHSQQDRIVSTQQSHSLSAQLAHHSKTNMVTHFSEISEC